ncbi:hypothetical protein O0L34_g7874 [Tuta absoluta]|nr:hypothetical protein O0L34_g7874 [Tuta absoluta]
MFNGQQLRNAYYPKERYKHQKYVYANLEPPYKHPVCYSFLDRYFNWTATYKLDSDVPLQYYTIIDKHTGATVGPSNEIQWVKDMEEVDEEFAKSLKSKTKAAAWNVNNCKSKERNEFVSELQEALNKFDLAIDVYGACGPYKCPREEQKKCNNKIKRDYYFYMALENSFYEDYVTEKVLHALSNNAIPIVFGGANYSRYLPPGSYINGRDHTAIELAAIMNLLIQNPQLYRQYFRWRNRYEFISTMPENQSGNKRMFTFTKHEGEGICNFCEAMNDEEKFGTETVVENIRRWWCPDYDKYC